MLSIILGSIEFLVGVFCGAMAFFLLVATVRTVFFGRDAYNANRRVVPTNIYRNWSGHPTGRESDDHRRMSHGIAYNISTKTVEEQKRLSAEAVDDVIGRRA